MNRHEVDVYVWSPVPARDALTHGLPTTDAFLLAFADPRVGLGGPGRQAHPEASSVRRRRRGLGGVPARQRPASLRWATEETLLIPGAWLAQTTVIAALDIDVTARAGQGVPDRE